ncbi:hypothetical protein Q7P37_010211 [Cladosporium fusiforme]
MRPATILSSFMLLAATSSASMLSNPLDALKREISPMLFERQDDSSSSVASSRESSAESTAESTGSSRTRDNESSSRTSASASSTASGDKKDEDDENGDETSSGKSSITKTSGSAKSSSGTSTKSETFDARNPAGGASMITPNALSPASYYKIKDEITFVWNYTSLSKAPAAVDVLATCTQNQAMYTISANMSFESTQSVIWDTGKYQATGTNPLLTETYTLIVHDAAKDVSATAKAGYLGTWNQFTFGMYEPQKYTPMADYVCATCNSAMSLMEKQTYGFMFAMIGVTLFTFGWFTGEAGLW